MGCFGAEEDGGLLRRRDWGVRSAGWGGSALMLTFLEIIGPRDFRVKKMSRGDFRGQSPVHFAVMVERVCGTCQEGRPLREGSFDSSYGWRG